MFDSLNIDRCAFSSFLLLCVSIVVFLIWEFFGEVSVVTGVSLFRSNIVDFPFGLSRWLHLLDIFVFTGLVSLLWDSVNIKTVLNWFGIFVGFLFVSMPWLVDNFGSISVDVFVIIFVSAFVVAVISFLTIIILAIIAEIYSMYVLAYFAVIFASIFALMIPGSLPITIFGVAMVVWVCYCAWVALTTLINTFHFISESMQN